MIEQSGLVAAVKKADPVLGLVSALISVFGILMIYSVTRNQLSARGVSELYYVERQSLYFAIGIGFCVICAAIDYRRLLSFIPVIYVGMCVMLLAVTFVGKSTRGTQAWFQVGSWQFQPSEFAKVGFVLCLAGLASGEGSAISNRRFLGLLLVSAVPTGLVLLQGDLGTSLVFGAITIAVIAVSGATARQLIVLGIGVAVVAAAALSFGVLKDYQVRRLTSFVNQPDSAAIASGSTDSADYNLVQSKKAIGSGGIAGRGLFEGPLTKYSYVPAQQTDFIFTAAAEQFGFLGSAVLLCAYAAISFRSWQIGARAKDAAGTLICVGVLAMLAFQIFENIGMTMGIMPITGIPLPMMSYGGTAMIATWAAVGLCINVGIRNSTSAK